MHSQERLKAISGSFQLAIFPINVAIIVFLWVFALYTPLLKIQRNEELPKTACERSVSGDLITISPKNVFFNK